MGPEWAAFLFTLAAVAAVLGTCWAHLREREREAGRRERTADMWLEHVDERWKELRDREWRLMMAGRRAP